MVSLSLAHDVLLNSRRLIIMRGDPQGYFRDRFSLFARARAMAPHLCIRRGRLKASNCAIMNKKNSWQEKSRGNFDRVQLHRIFEFKRH